MLSALRLSARCSKPVRHAVQAMQTSGCRGASSSTTGRFEKDDWRATETSTAGLPEVAMEVEDEVRLSISEEDLKARKEKSVEAWLEAKVGKERLELVKLLRKHNVIVRGGNEEGQKFVDALLEWKIQGPHE